MGAVDKFLRDIGLSDGPKRRKSKNSKSAKELADEARQIIAKGRAKGPNGTIDKAREKYQEEIKRHSRLLRSLKGQTGYEARAARKASAAKKQAAKEALIKARGK